MDKEAIDEEYKNWGKQPSTKITIEGKDGDREGIWVLELGDNLVGINNVPLMDDYRLMDIVRRNGTTKPELVHRKWHTRLWFNYEGAETEEGDVENRRIIYEALKDIGQVGFFWKGLAYILMEQETEPAIEIFEETSKSVPLIKQDEEIEVGEPS